MNLAWVDSDPIVLVGSATGGTRMLQDINVDMTLYYTSVPYKE